MWRTHLSGRRAFFIPGCLSQSGECAMCGNCSALGVNVQMRGRIASVGCRGGGLSIG